MGLLIFLVATAAGASRPEFGPGNPLNALTVWLAGPAFGAFSANFVVASKVKSVDPRSVFISFVFINLVVIGIALALPLIGLTRRGFVIGDFIVGLLQGAAIVAGSYGGWTIGVQRRANRS